MNNSRKTIKPISCIVEKATNFFKSTCTHIFKDASNKLKTTILIKNQEKFVLNMYANLYKPNTAALTSIPLKNIENPVLAST